MKNLISIVLVSMFVGLAVNAGEGNNLETNPTSIRLISQTMQGRMAEVLEKAGDPAQGQIDGKRLKEAYQASVLQVQAMADSTEKVTLTAANENLETLVEMIISGQFGPEQIKDFYANCKTPIQ